MIFVTVGTHEQPFNRLVKKIDELKGNGTIQDDVFIQTGFSTYEPKNCQWSKLIPYNQMIKNVEDARAVDPLSLRKFLYQELLVDKLVQTVDLRVCLLNMDNRHMFHRIVASDRKPALHFLHNAPRFGFNQPT